MTAKELKASILQLAVTGKLVPQDPNDEPASVLLERIKAEKAKLVKAGKIKQDKNPSEIVTGSDGAVYEKFKDGAVKDISGELPFEIPEGWVWARLEHCLISLHTGLNPRRFFRLNTADAKNYYVTIRELKSNKVVFSDRTDRINDEALRLCNNRSDLDEGDVLFAGTGSIGVMALIEEKPTNWNIKEGVYALKPSQSSISPRFLLYALQSEAIRSLFMQKAVGSTIASVPMKSLLSLCIPLPPFAEQKRIVAKIEKLMPLVEEYGKMEETRLQLDADLPATLEKSILQEAIQGKLVPQDPNDEPASELLKRIVAERKALVKAGKLKRDKTESVIFRGSDRLAYETRNGETVCIQDEIPFEIPDSWEWVRLGSVCSFVRGSGIKRSETTDSGSPCIRYGEIYTTYGYSFQAAKSFTSESVAAKCHKAHSGDVLCTLTGECKEEIAKATAYLGTEAIAIGGDLARISNHPYNPMLLVYFMFSPFMLSQKAEKSNGDIIVHIGKEAIENLLIPLPPIAEQERIVTKIANLLSTITSFTT